MTINIGIDETIIEQGEKHPYPRYIYVASCSVGKSFNVTSSNKEIKRKIRQEDFPSEFDSGFYGFLFRTFVLNNKGEGGVLNFRDKYLRTIASLIGESIDLSKEAGILNGGDIAIEIDGEEVLHAKEYLNSFLKKMGYYERSSVQFIVKGDKTKYALYLADTFAYFLRALSPHLEEREIVSAEDINLEQVTKLLSEGSDLTKRISRFHLQHLKESGKLEKIVA